MRSFLVFLFYGLLFSSQATSGPYEDGGIFHYDRERLSTYLLQTAKAADAGDAIAQFNLGYLYARGFGLSQDPMKALTWFRKAAEQGLPRAQNHLGLAYIEARGDVLQNYKEAARWFKKSAAQGDTEGAHLLAGLYSKGLGVPLSHSQALQWYLKAAEQNHAYAQLALGLNYSKGLGVEKSKTLAHMWFNLAAQNGSDLAHEYGRELVQTMTQEEIREAERLGNRWLAKHRDLEEKYFKIRDDFIREFAKATESIDERLALAKLERQMRAIAGPVRIDGFSGRGTINLLSLKAESGYAQVDGLRFNSDREVLFVTTQSLLKHYLAEHPQLPQSFKEASGKGDFYRRVFHADAGVMLYAEVPVKPTDDQYFAYAFLGISGQDIGPFIPNEIFIFAATEKQILLINAPASVKVVDIPPCRRSWRTSHAKSSNAFSEYRASQTENQQTYDDYRRYEEEGVAAYRDCFAKEAKQQPWFKALKNQTQSLVNRLQ